MMGNKILKTPIYKIMKMKMKIIQKPYKIMINNNNKQKKPNNKMLMKIKKKKIQKLMILILKIKNKILKINSKMFKKLIKMKIKFNKIMRQILLKMMIIKLKNKDQHKYIN